MLRFLLSLFRDRTERERPRWEDGSPRIAVRTGPTRLEFVKSLKPSQPPSSPGRVLAMRQRRTP